MLMHPAVVFGALIGGTVALAGFIVWWLTPPQSEFPEAETHERTLAALGALPPAVRAPDHACLLPGGHRE